MALRDTYIIFFPNVKFLPVLVQTKCLFFRYPGAIDSARDNFYFLKDKPAGPFARADHTVAGLCERLEDE